MGLLKANGYKEKGLDALLGSDVLVFGHRLVEKERSCFSLARQRGELHDAVGERRERFPRVRAAAVAISD